MQDKGRDTYERLLRWVRVIQTLKSSDLFLKLADSCLLCHLLLTRFGGFNPSLHRRSFGHDEGTRMGFLVPDSCLDDHDCEEGTWVGSNKIEMKYE